MTIKNEDGVELRFDVNKVEDVIEYPEMFHTPARVVVFFQRGVAILEFDSGWNAGLAAEKIQNAIKKRASNETP